ncbi:MAG: hypothetical protein EOO51_01470 [Flavobacterium sp.]|nr:MAG: hypothetical protein EOO51_01470 [Flavobacterium sp.]
MIKRLVLVSCMLFVLIASAQEGTSSPYSFYGIGESRFKGTAENRAIGGISSIPDSIHLNLQNPSFYSQLKFTTFTVGATYQTTKLQSAAEESKARRTTLDYLAVAFPIGKFGAGFGLMPFTSVGYKIKTAATAEDPISRKYTGTGGINKVFFGAGYEISKHLHIGAEFDYYFGNIETDAVYSITDVQLGTRESNESAINGAGLSTGISYRNKLNSKLSYFASAAFSTPTTLSLGNTRKIATVQFLATGGIRPVDEEDVPVADTKSKIPAKFTFGTGIGQDNKWMLAAEITTIHNQDLDNRFADIENSEFENSVRYAIGGFYIPNYNSFSSYFSRITYRAGFRYENTGLVLNDQSIKDYAVTAGLGLPLGGFFSSINASFEYGKRGTTSYGLLQENYASFSLSLSFNDRWFVKRRFD